MEAQDPEAIERWFENPNPIISGVEQGDICSLDESGFRVGIGNDQWVVTRDVRRAGFYASPQTRELITVVETVSGDGSVLPPFCIVKGIMQMEQWFQELPDNYVISTTASGFINDVLGLQYLRHFDKWSKRRQKGASRLLIMDGHGSHCTRHIINFAQEANIKLFAVPPHTTHFLQPLDVVIFQPYKAHHARTVADKTRLGLHEFTKADFFSALEDIRHKTFKDTTIMSAWKKLGIIPFKPEVVLQKLREMRCATPEPLSPTEHGTPSCARSLYSSGNNLMNRSLELSPSFRHALQSFV